MDDLVPDINCYYPEGGCLTGYSKHGSQRKEPGRSSECLLIGAPVWSGECFCCLLNGWMQVFDKGYLGQIVNERLEEVKYLTILDYAKNKGLKELGKTEPLGRFVMCI